MYCITKSVSEISRHLRDFCDQEHLFHFDFPQWEESYFDVSEFQNNLKLTVSMKITQLPLYLGTCFL